jgi:16S rRNA (adenine1518-N6/adenine1519-N6)-dimethyltransferase
VLLVLYAAFAHVDVPLTFPPGAFQPPPRVSSAVLRARFPASPPVPLDDPKALERLLHQAFAHRRKTLENNLEDSYPNLKQHLRLLNIEGSRRPETLSVVEFAKLAESLARDV